jgi:hypothetical protein
MKLFFISNLGFILLGAYLILTGLTVLIPSIALPPFVFGVLALVAGICILIGK